MNVNRNMRLAEVLQQAERRRRIMKMPIMRVRDRSNPLEDLDEVNFLQRYHLRKSTMLFVFNVIKADLTKHNCRGSPLPPLLELCLTVQFYVTDAFQLVIADLYKVNQATVSRIVNRVSLAIAKKAKEFIKYPSFQEAPRIRAEFYECNGFPGVVGCIDCTHVQIQSPGGDNAELFRNRKGVFSLNVQAICDAQLVFLDVVARWYGSCHDSRIFENSLIKDKLEHREVPGILLGDGGYACTPLLMTPLLTPVTPAEKRYNAAQIRTRNCIERAFGVWKRRFPCLKFLRVKLSNAVVIVTAVAALHNICRKRHDRFNDSDDMNAVDETPDLYGTPGGSATMSGSAARTQIISIHFSN